MPGYRGVGFSKSFKEAIGPKSPVGQITSGLECWYKKTGEKEPPLSYQSNNRVKLLGNIYVEVIHQTELSGETEVNFR